MEFSSQSSTQVCGTQEIPFSQNLDLSLMDDNVWGRLLSLKKNRPTTVYDLINESHSFGRGSANHQFTEDIFGEKVINVLSKIHFIISRESKPGSESIVILEDKSQNGTFINNELVGRNKKKLLQNNDEISLAHAKLKHFVFHDYLKNDSKEYPDVLTKKYLIMKKIGDGAYGEVHLAYSQDSFNRVAVKIIKKKQLSSAGVTMQLNNISTIQNEIQLLQAIDHPCIVRVLDVVESDDRIFIVMELAEGGELFQRIADNQKLNEPLGKLYFYQLVLAVEYLHKHKITHRDIKPENILLESEDDFTKVKLTDFGLSKITNGSLMTTFCGTQNYIAPELLVQENRAYANKVDIWSLGVVLYVSLSGYFPFSGNEVERILNIKHGRYNFSSNIWSEVSGNAKDLIQKLLVVDPNKRPSASDILKHPWLKDGVLLKRARQLLSPTKKVKSPVKRPLEADHSKDDVKTPKLMSGIEFTLNNMETN